ncbi:amidohydrolase [Streptococcus uberis]|uniref:amidohydrolase n=1 Tax=Streptococcus uberis TaxID=1349 RepID=UPI0006204A34|nr:amidohydrolase [Streptococcus uberis]KKF41945.1 amidohydrolase [Streptococcus uberis Ab71]KKF48053.1 amidohydrolase [Streptococcus uberis C5072]KKF49092.1 amidohydrolase [Streptococcus uberis C8329]KKF54007.1 amidohydrolase [Streptococcus uberis B190]
MAIRDVLSHLNDIKDWQEESYKHLHSHPELSMQERETVAYIEDKLKTFGYVTQKIGGGLVGILENGPGETVLFRADIDALPVKEETGLDYASTVETTDLDGNHVPVMHACGHDMHIAAALGAAWALANHKEEWTGTYIALFQPGEEIATGAKSMLEDGLLEKIPHPDIALAQHVLTEPVAGKVGVMSGPFLSTAASVKIVIKGKGAHGSMPHMSIDPIVIGSAIVTRLQTIVAREVDPFQFAVVTVGAFNAGLKANIIPEEATLLLNIRAYSDQVKEQLIDAIERIARAECQAGNCQEAPLIEVYDNFPLTDNSPEVVEKVKVSFENYLGTEQVVSYHPMTASEDFSAIPRALKIPYFYWGFGGFTEDQAVFANHNPKFAPAIHPTLETGTKAAVVAILTYLGK